VPTTVGRLFVGRSRSHDGSKVTLGQPLTQRHRVIANSRDGWASMAATSSNPVPEPPSVARRFRAKNGPNSGGSPSSSRTRLSSWFGLLHGTWESSTHGRADGMGQTRSDGANEL